MCTVMRHCALVALFFLALAVGACTRSVQPSGGAHTAPPVTATLPASQGGDGIQPVPIPGPDEPSGELAYQHVKVLAEEVGTRVAGTPAERHAADYLAAQFRSYGYLVELQEFPVENSTASLEVTRGPNRRIEGIAFGSDQSGSATGELVYIGLGRPADIPRAGLVGKVALIQRGEIEFQEKIRNAERSGAVGVVIYNNRPGLVQGVLREPPRIPAMLISQEDGEALLAAAQTGGVTVTVSVKVQTVQAVNVIARSRPGPCQSVTGGHFDSVATSPGGNDNGSGTAVVVEVSRVMAKQGHQRNDCFIAFGAEEEGLLGSRAFVRSLTGEERRQIMAMINLDMVGTPSPWQLIGSDRLVELAQRGAEVLGISAVAGRLPANAGSDHQSFAEAGIPVLMLFRDDNRLHTPQDTAAIVQPDSLQDAARLTVWVLTNLG